MDDQINSDEVTMRSLLLTNGKKYLKFIQFCPLQVNMDGSRWIMYVDNLPEASRSATSGSLSLRYPDQRSKIPGTGVSFWAPNVEISRPGTPVPLIYQVELSQRR
jgi:hypothetical protein